MSDNHQPVLRQACKADRDALVQLLEDSYRTTWAPHVAPDRWRSWSEQKRPASYVDAMGQEFVVATIADELAGMVHWRGDVIHALHVGSAFRRQGVGGVLLRHAEAAIAQAGHEAARLETDSFNGTSRAFYAKQGYTESGSRPDEEWDSGFVTLLLTKDLRNDYQKAKS
jgi:ribosomal protein S18 acetylase RimI-like enzyme